MGYKNFETLEGSAGEHQGKTDHNFSADSLSIQLPDTAFIKDAEFTRDGMDLVLQTDDGRATIENYFAAEPPPYLIGPDGSSLSPGLINSFLKSGSEYAQTATANDESPVGLVQEFKGEATVTHTDGTSEKIQNGTAIYQGDIIETAADGAVNVKFIDETSFAVSEDSRLAIDEYVFDPASAEGTTNFSVLKGMFVFTSGLIGREDPDDVHIETPAGSIGIRGTIIAGDVNKGEITVVEGAIVLRDPAGNEITLDNQFETARFNTANGSIDDMGQLPANDVMGKFSTIATVSPQLFSSIGDAASEGVTEGTIETTADDAAEGADSQAADDQGEAEGEASGEGQSEGADPANAGPDGATDPATDAQPQNDGMNTQQPATATTTTFAANSFTGAQSGFDSGSGTNATSTAISPIGATPIGAHSTAPAIVTAPPPPPPSGASTTTSTSLSTTLATTSLIKDITADTSGSAISGGGGTVGAFSATVTLVPVAENTMNGLIATISGVNATFLSNIAMTGPGASNFLVTRVDATTFEVRMAGSWVFDYEKHSSGTFLNYFTATSGDGRTFNGSFNPSVTDINEMPVYLADHVSQANFFAVSDPGGTYMWTYDFGSLFRDADGDTLTYSINNLTTLETSMLTLGAIAAAGDISMSISGLLSIDINSAFAYTNQTFNIMLDVSDGALTRSVTIAFDVMDVMGTVSASSTLAAGTNAYVSSAAFTVMHSGNHLLFDMASNTISISASTANNTINTGAGDDNVTITGYSINNNITTGSGDDTVTMNDLNNMINGDSGDDDFIIETSQTNFLNQLYSLTGNKINGGTDTFNLSTGNGGDVVFFTNSGGAWNDGDGYDPGTGDYFDPTQGLLIDFTAVDDTLIRNIEILDFDNGEDSLIRLNFNDVIAMTDGRKTLVIDGDIGDSLDFDALGNDFEYQETITDGTDTFDVYTSGNMTLVVDVDITQVTAIA